MRLGVDIGTTSIKCCLYIDEDNILYTKRVHNATLETAEGTHEQSVSKILSAVKEALSELTLIKYPEHTGESCNVLPVTHVSSCCQMHGVVLWSSDDVSNLITWQDARCDEEFLLWLRCQTVTEDLHNGYGSASLAWLQKYTPEVMSKYTHFGSISDYFVWLLCGMSGSDMSVMSDHNAESFGFFLSKSCGMEVVTDCWDTSAFEHVGISENRLPTIVPAGEQIGLVSDSGFNIALGAQVYVPIGDLQASVCAVLRGKAGKVFNYGTACQLIVTSDAELEPGPPSLRTSESELDPCPPSLRTTLYTKEHNLILAASLNGGNAMEVVHDFIKSFNSGNISYEEMMRVGVEGRDTTLRVDVKFNGERHAPKSLGTISNVSSTNFNFPNLVAATFRGIVCNVNEMMPKEYLDKVEDFYAVGINDRELLKCYVAEYFGEVKYVDEVTAAYGAVLFDIMANK